MYVSILEINGVKSPKFDSKKSDNININIMNKWVDSFFENDEQYYKCVRDIFDKYPKSSFIKSFAETKPILHDFEGIKLKVKFS